MTDFGNLLASAPVRRPISALCPVVCLVAVALWGTACGPVQYIAKTSGSTKAALKQAEKDGAARYAPYEFTTARAYLKKAHEEASHSQYQTALAYCQVAEEMAIKARGLARERRAAAKVLDAENADGQIPASDDAGKNVNPQPSQGGAVK